MTNVLVLWDIDGTLLAAGQDNAPYPRAIAGVVSGAEVEGFATDGMTDAQGTALHLERAGLDRDLLPAVVERMDIHSHEYLTTKPLSALPGVNEALEFVASLGATNALLTGNTPARAINKLRGAGIDTELIAWEDSFFGGNAESRSVMTHRARDRFPEWRIVVIGDTPLDGQAAGEAGLDFLGVTTGLYGAEGLEDAGAFLVIEDLVSGLQALGEALF